MELKVESGEVRGEEERERAPTRGEKRPPSVFSAGSEERKEKQG